MASGGSSKQYHDVYFSGLSFCTRTKVPGCGKRLRATLVEAPFLHLFFCSGSFLGWPVEPSGEKKIRSDELYDLMENPITSGCTIKSGLASTWL
jgi:hypothetical protein